ncbi:MAG: hypothetical protein SCARUB_01112 [Candidatus Scalindua rubra]|uniref:Uncharacterized protein n=1 Tax=Candidatus Scalindua rubra TaxID=1872076 RepID=A0A1E3XDN6_9BACT|nr:MAG: hypothetical protein SCARUB_01112 [Candidatus Scalindua rubra]
MSKLLIIEDVTTQLFKFVKNENRDTHLLLVTPQALIAFKNSGLKTYVPEDFISSQELSQLGQNNFQRARDFATLIDSYLHGKHISLKDNGFRLAFYQIDRFKILLDSIVSRVYILEQAIRRINPTQIYYAKNTKEYFDEALFSNKSIYSALLPIVASQLLVPTIAYPIADPIASGGYNAILKDSLVILGKLYKKMITVKKRRKQIHIVETEKKYTVLGINPAYDLHELLNMAQVLNMCNVWIWSGFKKSPVYGKLFVTSERVLCLNKGQTHKVNWSGITPDQMCEDNRGQSSLFKQLTSLCADKRISWFPVIESRIKFFLTNIVPEGYAVYHKTRAVLREIAPDVVFSNGGIKTVREGMMMKAVRDCGIPFAMVQHGGGGYGLLEVPNVFIRDFEQVPESYYIMWGQGVKKFFLKYSEKYKVNIIPAGSLLVRNIFKHRAISKTGKGTRVIYYICNDFKRNITYYPGGLHYTDTWYFRLHMKILKLFEKYPSNQFVFKVPPGFKEYSLYKKLVQDFPYIQIESKPLMSIIHKPALYIIDSLSTTIVQAAATRVPIIVYVGEHSKEANPEALCSLKKTCCLLRHGSRFL